MLLLLVLSILALFIVIGAVGILLALRARESAVAFAAASANQAGSSALARSQLDAALLKLVRGPSAGAGALGRDVTESLLEDRYGLPETCSVSGIAGTSGAFLTATVTGLVVPNPTAVAGRVLTFVPAVGDPTGPTSYRVLGVGAANTLLLANVKPYSPLALPTVFPCDAVLNGREFSGAGQNEAYDAFDAQNPFLTVPGLDVVVAASGSTFLVSGTLFTSGTFAVGGASLTSGTHALRPLLFRSAMAKVQSPAFGTTGTPCTVDNDGDGVPDGIWLDGVLPPQRSSGGGQLSFSVSYLVLDLDGRVNLNAHGSLVRAQSLQSSAQYPRDPATVPVGMGYGPADADAARLVSPVEVQSGTALPVRYGVLLQGGNVTTSATVSTGTQWRPTPRVEATQVGRYGSSVGPGDSAQTTATNAANADYWLRVMAGNSPTDLKARLQVFTDGNVLTFNRPTPPWVGGTDPDDLTGSGTTAHPYALRLDEDAPRAAGSAAIDALFTVAELERILRPFDADAATLAPRLAAILDDFAERSRLTVTTDSWDTPAITGNTATQIGAAVTGGNVSDVLSPETVAGLRFNLNRPIQGLAFAPERQAYFRHLYTLCVALGAAPAAAAQWAANVIEFRDPDSIMTWYPYDSNPLDGVWAADSGVWGAERPEMVIKSATTPPPPSDQVTVALYRPWAAVCTGSGGASVPTERIDDVLGSAAANTLDVTRMDVANTGTNAIWRLTAGGTTAGLDKLITTGTAVGTNADVPQATLTGNASPTEVVLQRLADPTRVRETDPSNPATYNDYVTIDKVSVPQAPPRGTPSRWLHWPNRDLVSHGELLVVQSGSAADLAGVLFDESQESSLARTTPAILEATLVPSRFAGANVSAANGATSLGGTGYENFQYGQLSRWREAGRVNVNTILPNVGNTPPALDNAVWTAVLGRSGTSSPVGLTITGTPAQTATYAPITRDRDLLVAGGEARLIRSGTDAASAFLRRSSAVRLANVATTRSHVFAVWITLRITDSSPNAPPPQFARVFAIVDRSIPVGYAPGRTLNVRETIRLVRFLQ